MKIIHQNGYSKEELLTFKPTIFKNTIDSVQLLVLAIKKMELPWGKPKNKVCICIYFFVLPAIPSIILKRRFYF